jgi:hypothetical protein
VTAITFTFGGNFGMRIRPYLAGVYQDVFLWSENHADAWNVIFRLETLTIQAGHPPQNGPLGLRYKQPAMLYLDQKNRHDAK